MFSVQPLERSTNVGRIDVDAEVSILWSPDGKSLFVERKDCGQEEKGVTKNEMDGITNSVDMSLSKLWEIVKGSLVCCSLWGCEELDMTWCLKNNNKMVVLFLVF